MHRQPEKGNAPEVAATGASSVENQPVKEGFNVSNSTEVQVSSQPVFSFGEHAVRVVVRDGEPWFVASDVAKALEFRDASNAARMLSAHQKGTHSVSTVQGNQQVTVVSEGGLYRMVLRSRKPSAVAFSDWVTDEVLPAIRKTGVYVGKPFAVNPGDVLTQDEQNTLRLMLKTAAERLPKEKQGGAMVKGWSKLKAHFGVSYREIPRQEFSEAVSIIARHAAEWELVDDEPTPPEDTDRVKIAFSLAAEASARVQRTVFDAAMAGDITLWKHSRYLLDLNYDRNNSRTVPLATMLALDQVVVSMDELPERISGPDCLQATEVQLAKLAEACAQRLARRAQQRSDCDSAQRNAGGFRQVAPGVLMGAGA